MSSHSGRAPVSNTSAMQAVTLGELPPTIAAVARQVGFAVIDIERKNLAQVSIQTLLIFRPGDGFVFIKCIGDGKLSKAQGEWNDFVTDTGGRVVVVRPPDLLWFIDCLRMPAGAEWPKKPTDG